MVSPLRVITCNRASSRGSIIVLTLISVTVFVTLFSSLAGYLLTQSTWVGTKTEQERALQIAEAGIEYYRWRLSHFPDDITDGTGVAGPYVHTYSDPEVGPIGQFSLEIGGNVLCGEVQVVHATSTGWTLDDPNTKRTIAVRIARPTVADYSYIVDSPVYAGSSRTIIGPYHGNSIVRMDGNNQSAVTSRLATSSCATLGGCTGVANGVYGAGTHPEWWRWGVAEIPFGNFDFVFGSIEQKAIDHGIHLPKISDDAAGPYGYYLELQSDQTVDIYRVTHVNWITSDTPADGDANPSLPELLGPTTFSHTGLNAKRQAVQLDVPIPADCPLIYASDRVWLEGTVRGKVTVVANDVGAASPDLFLQDNIQYSTTTGADGLTVLAERHLLIPLYVPNDMIVNGVFFAQKGSYGRNWYFNDIGNLTVPFVGANQNYNGYKEQNSLSTTGTVISKLRTGTQWGTTQGFENRYDYYDRNLAKGPPPRTPYTSPNFRFIEWREAE